ncbi:hypothetical protein ACFR99_15200 [Haloarchaeobius amylolyticus]|uniref:DUF7344 domain-containing protein n=1 Tax=Haloarchaeobius amylolyticus TaxID=1198296 RepID=A0ABD6BII2_9EURY
MSAWPLTNGPDTDYSQAEVDEFVRALGNPRFRRLLSILETHEGDRLSLDTVLERLPGSGQPERRRWLIALTHNYLPRLAELGVVDYDRSDSSVRYHGCPLVADPLELLETD